MAYVYGSTMKRPAPVIVTAPVEAVPDPVTKEKAVRKGRAPGRKRGQGKNNKHGTGCGTNNGWAAHKRANEPVCNDCYWAHREYANEVAREARARKAVTA